MTRDKIARRFSGGTAASRVKGWLELLVESGLVPQAKLAGLMKECDEITAIIVASIRTAKERRE